MSANYALMHVWYERVGVGLLPAKFLTEAMLFTVSYQVQKRFIFASDSAPASHGDSASSMPSYMTETTSVA